jgi:hypothetical protein
VINQTVGLHVYGLKSFSCDSFKLFFHLWNPSGLARARISAASNSGPHYDWVQKKNQGRVTYRLLRLSKQMVSIIALPLFSPLPLRLRFLGIYQIGLSLLPLLNLPLQQSQIPHRKINPRCFWSSLPHIPHPPSRPHLLRHCRCLVSALLALSRRGKKTPLLHRGLHLPKGKTIRWRSSLLIRRHLSRGVSIG